jgi:hypothetical protein
MVALDEQTVVVPGTAAAETVLPRLADALRDVYTGAPNWPRRWRRYSMHTLLPRS